MQCYALVMHHVNDVDANISCLALSFTLLQYRVSISKISKLEFITLSHHLRYWVTGNSRSNLSNVKFYEGVLNFDPTTQ